jgi:hypothetical protein
VNREQFQATNKELRSLRLHLIDIEEDARLKEHELESISAEFMADICETMDEATGKAKFSNAEKRDAELAIRQTSSMSWICNDQELTVLKSKAAKTRVDIQFFDNDIKWGIGHAADEVNAQLASIEARVEEATNHAAYAALRQLFANISIGEPIDH